MLCNCTTKNESNQSETNKFKQNYYYYFSYLLLIILITIQFKFLTNLTKIEHFYLKVTNQKQKKLTVWSKEGFKLRPDLFCFLFGLLTAEGNSVWFGSPFPFLSLQLSESLPLPTPSLLPDRDKDSGEP